MITDPGAARPLVVIQEHLPEAQLERLNNTVEVVYEPDLNGDSHGCMRLCMKRWQS